MGSIVNRRSTQQRFIINGVNVQRNERWCWHQKPFWFLPRLNLSVFHQHNSSIIDLQRWGIQKFRTLETLPTEWLIGINRVFQFYTEVKDFLNICSSDLQFDLSQQFLDFFLNCLPSQKYCRVTILTGNISSNELIELEYTYFIYFDWLLWCFLCALSSNVYFHFYIQWNLNISFHQPNPSPESTRVCHTLSMSQKINRIK